MGRDMGKHAARPQKAGSHLAPRSPVARGSITYRESRERGTNQALEARTYQDDRTPPALREKGRSRHSEWHGGPQTQSDEA